MARKNVIEPYKLFNKVDMSTQQTSKETSIMQVDNIEFIVAWDGAALNGELLVQVASQVKDDPDATVWADLDFGAPVVINTANGNHLININQKCGNKIRVSWMPTAGTGELTVIITAKSVGA